MNLANKVITYVIFITVSCPRLQIFPLCTSVQGTATMYHHNISYTYNIYIYYILSSPCVLCNHAKSCFTNCNHVLPCVTVCYRVLPCVTVCYRVLPCVTVCYRVLPCVTVCYRVLPCVTVCYRVLLNVTKC